MRDESVDSRKRIKAARAAWERLADELEDDETKPDTVTIADAGEYAIDIKGLLEKNPIVVHKDGAYMIHLPSLFGGK